MKQSIKGSEQADKQSKASLLSLCFLNHSLFLCVVLLSTIGKGLHFVSFAIVSSTPSFRQFQNFSPETMGFAASFFNCCSFSSSCTKEFNLPNLEQLKDFRRREVTELTFKIYRLISEHSKGKGNDEPLTEFDYFTSALMEAGGDIVQTLSNHINWRKPKGVALTSLNAHAIMLVSYILNKLSTAACVGIVASIVLFCLKQHAKCSFNKKRRRRFLQHTSALAKAMNNLHDEQQREKFRDIFAYIVKVTAICSLQMQRPCLCRLIFSYGGAEDLQNMEEELTDKYEDLKFVAHSYSSSAVDMEHASKAVKRKLDLPNPSTKVVAIYGLGGIGKTTFATQVVKMLDLSSYIYCRLYMETASNNIPSLQAEFLQTAFDQYDVVPNDVDGRTMLSKAFAKISKPLFLFIDNALRRDELERLLPIKSLARLPSKSRILVTTRNLSEVKVLRESTFVSSEEHRVGPISSKQKAERLLFHFAFSNPDYSVKDANVEGLLDICQGIPSIIKMAGRELHDSVIRKDQDVANACSKMIGFMSEVPEEGWFSRETHRIVEFAFMRLSKPSKEGFFHIIYFLLGWKRKKVAYALGETVLEELEDAAFVTTDANGKIQMDNIIREYGRILSVKFEEEYGIRISDVESWGRVINDIQMDNIIREDARIRAVEFEEEYGIRSSDVESGNGVKYDNEKWRKIKGIRLSGQADDIEYISRCSEMQILILENVAVGMTNLHLPDSLRLLVLDGQRCNHLQVVHQPEKSDLRLIKVAYINADWFLQSMTEFKDFVYLKLSNCDKSGQVTGRSCYESPLKELKLCRLDWESVPAKTFVNRPCLEKLSIKKCYGLTSIPDELDNLRNLKILQIRDCPIQKIPETLSTLTSVFHLHVTDCKKLEENALNTFLQMKNLLVLCMDGDPMLIKGWENIQWECRALSLLGGSLMLKKNQMGCLFGGAGGSGFFRMEADYEELVWKKANMWEEAKGKLCLFSTGKGDTISEKCRRVLKAATEDGREIVYVDSGVSRWHRMCNMGEKVKWDAKDKEVMRKVLGQLPHGCSWRVWTSSFPKNCLLFTWLLFIASCESTRSIGSLQPVETFIVKGKMEEEKHTGKVMLSKELSLMYWEGIVEKPKMEGVTRIGLEIAPLGFLLLRMGLIESLTSFFKHL